MVTKSKRALVCGVSGQDGALLSKFLVDLGYDVLGTSRDVANRSFRNLDRVGVRGSIKLTSCNFRDFRRVLEILRDFNPTEIYYLSAQSSVSLSFEQPLETFSSGSIGILNLLEALRFLRLDTRVFHASSSECYGNIPDTGACEATPFDPRSPYAVAKASSHYLVRLYREAYGIYASNGILFNHESALRPKRFVTSKIVNGAARIAAGECMKLCLGNISISRDWGWADDYVRAIWLSLQMDKSDDFVIATGVSTKLEDFLQKAFIYFGLNYQDHVVIDQAYMRPSDILYSRGDASKAQKLLGWKAEKQIDDIISLLCSSAYDEVQK